MPALKPVSPTTSIPNSATIHLASDKVATLTSGTQENKLDQELPQMKQQMQKKPEGNLTEEDQKNHTPRQIHGARHCATNKSSTMTSHNN